MEKPAFAGSTKSEPVRHCLFSSLLFFYFILSPSCRASPRAQGFFLLPSLGLLNKTTATTREPSRPSVQSARFLNTREITQEQPTTIKLHCDGHNRRKSLFCRTAQGPATQCSSAKAPTTTDPRVCV